MPDDINELLAQKRLNAEASYARGRDVPGRWSIDGQKV
jgi:hypothetical protein